MVRYAIIDDTDPALVYTGDWRILQTPVNPRTPEYNGTVHATNDPTATVTYRFNGTVLDVFGTIDAPATYGYPNASFIVTPTSTGSSLKHLNQSGFVPPIEDQTIATSHIELFKTGVMDRGVYTMNLTTDGVSQGGPTFYLDFLRVLVPDGIFIESIPVDDNESQWDFTGNWVPGDHTGDYLYSAHSTPHEGGSATLKFYGSEISIYGTLNGNYREDTPIAYINVDGGKMHNITAQDITDQPLESGVPLRNQMIFSTSGLTDLGMDQRTLTISIPPMFTTPTPTDFAGSAVSASAAPASTISNPSWFLDYAIYGPYSAGVSSSQPTGTASPSSPPSSPPSTPPPAGTIAGGVIGAFALVTVVVAAFLFWRRRKQRQITAASVKERHPLNEADIVSAYTNTECSRPTLFTVGTRRLSMHKGAVNPTRQVPSAPLTSLQSTESDGPISPGPMTSQAVQSISGHGDALSVRQEIDGGVRLARGSSEVVNILPPRYAQYDDDD